MILREKNEKTQISRKPSCGNDLRTSSAAILPSTAAYAGQALIAACGFQYPNYASAGLIGKRIGFVMLKSGRRRPMSSSGHEISCLVRVFEDFDVRAVPLFTPRKVLGQMARRRSLLS